MAKEPGDSGMASFDEGSKDATPEKPKAIVAEESDDEVGLSYLIHYRIIFVIHCITTFIISRILKCVNVSMG